MNRLIGAAILTVLLLAIITPTTFADDNIHMAPAAPPVFTEGSVGAGKVKFEVTGPPEVQTHEDSGVTYIEVTQQISQEKQPSHASVNGVGDINPDASSQQPVGSHTVEWANCLAYQGSSKVRHCYARTKKVSGTGDYGTEAHATLIEGDSQGVEYGDDIVFSQFTDACAKDEKTNQTAETCESSWQNTYSGQWWYLVSGHDYDLGANGSVDASCPGCIDWQWEA